MALGDPYAPLPDLKARYDIADTVDDARLTAALASASREIELYCGRQFNDAATPTARLFSPTTGFVATVDDFSTTTGLIVETAADGATWQTWAAVDYLASPTNGTVAGQTGWPYWRLATTGGRRFIDPCRRPTLRVTARWGWSAVPTPVAEACLLIASESFKLADAPFGVAGFGEFGPVRVRMNSRAQSLLGPYRVTDAWVG